MERARMPRAVVMMTGDANRLREHQVADPNGRALHPTQARGGRKHIRIDERREDDVRIGQQPAERVAVPGFEKSMLREVALELADEVPRHHPYRRRADDADQDIHLRQGGYGRVGQVGPRTWGTRWGCERGCGGSGAPAPVQKSRRFIAFYRCPSVRRS